MDKRLWRLVAIMGTTFVLIIGTLQWWKYSNFEYNAMDLGIYSQTVWSLGHGHGFASSIHDPSYLGDHLELWLVPAGWLYRLWSSPLTLLWLQTVVIALTVIPLVKVSQSVLGRRGAIITAAAFFLNPLVYNIAVYEFHGLVFALPLIAWSMWYYERRRYWLWLLSLIGLVLVREDMPLVAAGWGLLAAIDRRAWRWWLPPLVLAGAWFWAAQGIIQAANHDSLYKYWQFYHWLGDSPAAILSFPFRHPLVFLRTVGSVSTLGNTAGLLLAAGLLPLLRPRRLWPLVFVFGQLVLSNTPTGSFLRTHYTVPYLPFLAWAALYAWRDIRQGVLLRRFDHDVVRTAVVAVGLIGPVYASMLFGPPEFPWKPANRLPFTPAVILRATLRTVRPDDRVLTTFAYLPYLANRQSVYSLNYVYLGHRQYSTVPYDLPSDIDLAIIDWQELYEYQFVYPNSRLSGRSGPQRLQDLLAAHGLGVVQRLGSVTVYRPNGSADASSVQIQPDNQPETGLGMIALLGQPIVAVSGPIVSGWRSIAVDSRWRAVSTQPDSPISIRYELHQAGRVVWQQTQLLGQGPVPASEWPVGTAWQTHDTLLVPVALGGQVALEAIVGPAHGRYGFDRVRAIRTFDSADRRLTPIFLGQLTLPPRLK